MEENPIQCFYQAFALLLIKKDVCSSETKKGLLQKIKHTVSAAARDSLVICRIMLKFLKLLLWKFSNIHRSRAKITMNHLVSNTQLQHLSTPVQSCYIYAPLFLLLTYLKPILDIASFIYKYLDVMSFLFSF